MAATSRTRPGQDAEDENVVPFNKLHQAVETRDRRQRLPHLSCADIEDFFAHAEKRNRINKLAA
ncbi:hypothetical protein [Maritimibacter sp. DP1N21-5]|uniref:hypothetical protein n=1 Tax=Maritimibacter sp. DP1N21-5 TaxID=2836867 RepID=UPI001C4587D8|nr:hypothetical protein [Maritimibacter sp. DP1N21-5]MBV7407587.1 hypothetical protein [Maritimibacter sp. DP1N21-5]